MPKTILIADDNDDLRSMIAYQLQARGYRILMASDGRQAIEKCRNDKPDLVLLDVMMPGMDGTEAGALLKTDPVTRHIPIIFLTSLVQDEAAPEFSEDRQAMPKSASPEELVQKIEQALRQ